MQVEMSRMKVTKKTTKLKQRLEGDSWMDVKSFVTWGMTSY